MKFIKRLFSKDFLYLILLVYLVVAYFYPVIGLIAIVCMIAPVWMSIYRGRYWCGNYCPRGSFYDRVISKISFNRRIPKFLRSTPFRVFMVMFIFAMFGVQLYFAWGDIAAIGRVFWLIILVTTIVGIILGIIYAPRAWCSFCPMGTLSAAVAPRKPKLTLKNIRITSSCVLCKRCAKVCPMQLEPYYAKGVEEGYMNIDCIKCGVCVSACPKKCMNLR